jgi:hypothetical protein
VLYLRLELRICLVPLFDEPVPGQFRPKDRCCVLRLGMVLVPKEKDKLRKGETPDEASEEAGDMTCDPCAGHACDHCAICDGQGTCCATVSRPTISSAPNQQQDLDVLRTAIATDRMGEVGILALLQGERSAHEGLLAIADKALVPVSTDSEGVVANAPTTITGLSVIRALPASTVPDSRDNRTTHNQTKEVIHAITARTYP